jgi:hypothetical protein
MLTYKTMLQRAEIMTKQSLNESRSGEVYSIQHYVIKFVGDLRQFVGFLAGTPVSSTIKN